MHKTTKYIIFLITLVLLSTSTYALTRGISIANWQYDPNTLTIGEGMTVIWTNNEVGSTHRVLIRGLSVSSDLLFPGESFNYTFNEVGFYNFYDSASPARLKGNITVIPEEEYTYCGDGICNEEKTECCTDCGCEIDHYCFNNVCVKNVTKTTQEPQQPIEETRPTNYLPLLIGATILMLVLIAIILIKIVRKK